jgi:tRNA U34 2-thiouridine synthase MnmA/TrmU
MTTAIGCISGGLDSMLAVRIIQRLGIEVVALHALHLWHSHAAADTRPPAVVSAEAMGVRVVTVDAAAADLAMVQNPRHGLGKRMNPCIDCRIWTLGQARRVMEAEGAAFVFTGEVLGQRPMSQRRPTMDLVERESGLTDRLLRPLCAKHLPPTKAERDGLVDRARLYDFRGRTRKPQMALAKELGLTAYPSPAGGCLLTDPGFAHRLRTLMAVRPPTAEDVELLKVGRHFRLPGGAWLVLGRHQEDNDRLAPRFQPGDVRLEAAEIPGPTGLLRGGADDATVALAAALLLRYTKTPAGTPHAVRVTGPGDAARDVIAAPAAEADAQAYLVALEGKA